MTRQRFRYVLPAEDYIEMNRFALKEQLCIQGFSQFVENEQRWLHRMTLELTRCQIDEQFSQLLAYQQQRYSAQAHMDSIARYLWDYLDDEDDRRSISASLEQYNEFYERLRDATMATEYLIGSLIEDYIDDPWHSWTLRLLDRHFVLEDHGFSMSDRIAELLDISSTDLEKLSCQILLNNGCSDRARLCFDGESWEIHDDKR